MSTTRPHIPLHHDDARPGTRRRPPQLNPMILVQLEAEQGSQRRRKIPKKIN